MSMLSILSPAKTLDLSPHGRNIPPTPPPLLTDASTLASVGQKLSVSDVQSLMKVSTTIAERTVAQFQAFSVQLSHTETPPAALTFAGAVYQGLDARSLDEAELTEANARLAILSGLYGVLRPLDAMRPYRLEMGTRLQNPHGANLYRFWGDRIAHQLNAMTEGHEDRTIINLASKEYCRAVNRSALAGGIIDIAFKERSGNTLKTVAVYAKRARGLMARFVVQQRLDTPDGLRAFTGMDYRFDASASSTETWVFAR